MICQASRITINNWKSIFKRKFLNKIRLSGYYWVIRDIPSKKGVWEMCLWPCASPCGQASPWWPGRAWTSTGPSCPTWAAQTQAADLSWSSTICPVIPHTYIYFSPFLYFTVYFRLLLSMNLSKFLICFSNT